MKFSKSKQTTILLFPFVLLAIGVSAVYKDFMASVFILLFGLFAAYMGGRKYDKIMEKEKVSDSATNNKE